MLWIMDISGWSIKNENLLLEGTKQGDKGRIKVCWYYKKDEYIFGIS